MAYHKTSQAALEIKITHNLFLRPLTVEDVTQCGGVLQEKDDAFSPTIYEYFSKGYLGFGALDEGKMVGYCFIKNPAGGGRPETLTVVRKKWRGNGIATALRNFAINTALQKKELVGDFIYSATEIWNTASWRSLLRSNYEITEITGEGDKRFIQLRRKLK